MIGLLAEAITALSLIIFWFFVGAVCALLAMWALSAIL